MYILAQSTQNYSESNSESMRVCKTSEVPGFHWKILLRSAIIFFILSILMDSLELPPHSSGEIRPPHSCLMHTELLSG